MHSLHVRYQIALQVAFESATFPRASVLVGVVDAAVFRQLVARIEGFLADITVEGFPRFLAQVDGFVLLQEEVEVELLGAVIAVPFGIVRVVDPMIVERGLRLVALLAGREVTAEAADVVRVFIADVVHQGLLQAEGRLALIALERTVVEVDLLLVVLTAGAVGEELRAVMTLLKELHVGPGHLLHVILLAPHRLVRLVILRFQLYGFPARRRRFLVLLVILLQLVIRRLIVGRLALLQVRHHVLNQRVPVDVIVARLAVKDLIDVRRLEVLVELGECRDGRLWLAELARVNLIRLDVV